MQPVGLVVLTVEQVPLVDPVGAAGAGRAWTTWRTLKALALIGADPLDPEVAAVLVAAPLVAVLGTKALLLPLDLELHAARTTSSTAADPYNRMGLNTWAPLLAGDRLWPPWPWPRQMA